MPLTTMACCTRAACMLAIAAGVLWLFLLVSLLDTDCGPLPAADLRDAAPLLPALPALARFRDALTGHHASHHGSVPEDVMDAALHVLTVSFRKRVRRRAALAAREAAAGTGGDDADSIDADAADADAADARALRVAAARLATAVLAAADDPGFASLQDSGTSALLPAAQRGAQQQQLLPQPGQAAARSDGVGASSTAPAPGGGTAPRLPAAPPAPPPPERDMFTRQTCYFQTDEAESCTYEGVLCFDGTSPLAVVSRPVRAPDRVPDTPSACMDPRYYEPGSPEDGGCAYMTSGERKSFNASAPPHPPTDTPMSMRRRRWGPLNRNGLLLFREVEPHEVWGDQPHHVWEEGGDGDGRRAPPPDGWRANDTEVVVGAPGAWPGLPGLRVRRVTRTRNVTVNWLDGAMWLAGIDGQWNANPYHWFSKVGALYDAVRANASGGAPPDGAPFGSHPADAYPQWGRAGIFGSLRNTLLQDDVEVAAAAARRAAAGAGGGGGGGGGRAPPLLRVDNPHNTLAWRVGAQWEQPPMDFIFFTGDGAREIPGRDALADWFGATLALAVPPTAAVFFKDALSQLSRNNIVCARRGAIPGAKNKFFTGRADAWLYRQYAYTATGQAAAGRRPHPRYPPRKITVVDRKGLPGRGIYNKADLMAAVEATGLPYELVPSLGRMSFKAQVDLMAGTGILLAPHGAGLANAMFLPAHAVVIELFPYLMKKNTYRTLAHVADLHYTGVFSWDTLDPSLASEIYGVRLVNDNEFWSTCVATNMSSYDALNFRECNGASKNYPIVVDPGQLRAALRDAVDTIGAFDTHNPEWAALLKAANQPKPSPPAHLTLNRA